MDLEIAARIGAQPSAAGLCGSRCQATRRKQARPHRRQTDTTTRHAATRRHRFQLTMCSLIPRGAAETHLPRTPSASSLAASQAATPARGSPEFADEARARLKCHADGARRLDATCAAIASGAGRAFGATAGCSVAALLLLVWCSSAVIDLLATMLWSLCSRFCCGWASRQDADDGCARQYASVESELRYGRHDRGLTPRRVSTGRISAAALGVAAVVFYLS